MKIVRHRTIGSLALLSAALVAGSITQGTAHAAEPNCKVTDNLTRVGDEWQLELNADCNADSAVYKIVWRYEFWAEPSGGGEVTTTFTKLNEKKEAFGRKNLVRKTAPAGYSRYCYKGEAQLVTPKVLKAPHQVYQVGTHCKET